MVFGDAEMYSDTFDILSELLGKRVSCKNGKKTIDFNV